MNKKSLLAVKMAVVRTTSVLFALILVSLPKEVGAQDLPASLPEINYHLTALPWEPLNIPSTAYLDAVEGMARVASYHLDESGAIIDPYLHREHQYSTPYFAIAVGSLIEAGRAKDLWPAGIKAMEKSLVDFSGGNSHIPDQHGEFYIAALAEAMELYRGEISREKYENWEELVSTPIENIWKGWDKSLNNWRTYAMKGEWARAVHGFADRQKTIEFIEKNWNYYTQYERIGKDKWNLYQDWTSDPQSHAVEAVGRGNLTALALSGYDGSSAEQMFNIIRRGGMTSMLLLSPAGQCPPNGRTDNHVFNDILYQLIFEALAEDAKKDGNLQLAGQFRRSAMLAFRSIQRWKRTDDPWGGSFYITKNYFDPGDRIGYQPASQWGNYSGAMMFHLAECYLTRKSEIEEIPAPTEIGGYALETDSRFSTFVANAGGMQVFINLRGASVPKYNVFWTPLGTVRFSKVNWDDRLGPSDGEKLNNTTGQPTVYSRGVGESEDIVYPQTGLTFGPTWMERDRWTRIADVATHYQGTVTTEFAHPLLVRFRVTYAYVTGRGGPYFQQDFIVTPDGVMTWLSCRQEIQYGLSVPLLANDGRKLETSISEGIASTKYRGEIDSQNFIGLNRDSNPEIDGIQIRSTYGDLLPVKFQSSEDRIAVFVYPRAGNDPEALNVKESFMIQNDGFSSTLGKVQGNMYYGRFSAGGYGKGLDLDDDGKFELSFNIPCGFIAQLREGKIMAVETDRGVEMEFNNEKIKLLPFQPFYLKQ